MQSIAQNGARTTKIVETEEETASLRRHLKEVIEGEAFKGSPRSSQFLTYIIEESIAGHSPALKERIIGLNVFGRPPTYDTGEDAIVRVTASDVRKRLLQHYGRYGATSEFRITLPLGSYVPEITRDPQHSANGRNSVEVPIATPQIVRRSETPNTNSRRTGRWLFFAISLLALNLAVWGILASHFSRFGSAPVSILPWSAFFNSQRSTQLITSDPNIAEIQGLTGSHISLSDYANQQYIPNASSLSPQMIFFCRDILRGDKAAAVDARVIANIAQLAQAASNKLTVHVARDIRLSDLYLDNNFIFLGSPRSNPWTTLFNDQLDFRFAFDDRSQQEIIRNVHPRSGESSTYIPTAKGWGTGQSFATISFIQNSSRDGQVLLLAGANGEGTGAAGELVANMKRLSSALQSCGISSSNPVEHFQLLLRLNTMAGSPSNVDVIACHILPGASIQSKAE